MSDGKLTRQIVPATTISVALTTYNGEKYLREQLNSIGRQSLAPMELIVTDDGSTDATFQILEEFSRTVSFPVRVHRNQTRLGYADNFLKAISLCSGDLVAFSDQDDIWLSEKLKTCSAFFSDPMLVFTMHSAAVIDENGRTGAYFPRFLKTRILNPGACSPFVAPGTEVAVRPGFTMMVRRGLMDLVDPKSRPEQLYGHDWWTWFLAATTGRVALVQDVLAEYRQHQNNVCGAQEVKASENFRRSTSIPDYGSMAEYEIACSQLLKQAVEKAPVIWQPAIKRSVRKLAVRSNLHRIRSKLYNRQTSFLDRSLVFFRLLISGGYLPDRTRTRLGIRAGMKDVVFGVAGFRRS